MVEWILLHKHRLSDLLHYLDDFSTAGPPQSFQCAYNLNTAISVCHRLGLPLHGNKCVGPATSMTILGIELDSVNQDHPVQINQEFRLDLQWWQQFLASWHGVGFWLYPGMSATTDLEVTLDAADNKAVVAILTTRTSKVPALMHLLRDLLFSAVRWGFTFTAAHVPGVKNKIADAISRFRWQEFRQLAPEAHSCPCPIPQLLLDSLTPPP
ncbi:unnamed protein product [Porites lobata]|uniref:Reverse transcriptase domain-containing protein n=1 Tax=Porites lobata TaxID=104759 RepID=A0ABN8PPU0_9CNID|nr:unnamed protein product [Porites lobata]